MIQRFTGDPINVPARFFDNLNFAIFQEVVEAPGGGIARRVTGIDEVIGYNKFADGILTRGMFEWDPVTDKHYALRGMFQSHLMENKMAPMMGFANKREIYDEMELTDGSDSEDGRSRSYSLRRCLRFVGRILSRQGWEQFSAAIDTWVGVKPLVEFEGATDGTPPNLADCYPASRYADHFLCIKVVLPATVFGLLLGAVIFFFASSLFTGASGLLLALIFPLLSGGWQRYGL